MQAWAWWQGCWLVSLIRWILFICFCSHRMVWIQYVPEQNILNFMLFIHSLELFPWPVITVLHLVLINTNHHKEGPLVYLSTRYPESETWIARWAVLGPVLSWSRKNGRTLEVEPRANPSWRSHCSSLAASECPPEMQDKPSITDSPQGKAKRSWNDWCNPGEGNRVWNDWCLPPVGTQSRKVWPVRMLNGTKWAIQLQSWMTLQWKKKQVLMLQILYTWRTAEEIGFHFFAQS